MSTPGQTDGNDGNVLEEWFLREFPEPVWEWERDAAVWARASGRGKRERTVNGGGVNPYADGTTEEALGRLRYREQYNASSSGVVLANSSGVV